MLISTLSCMAVLNSRARLQTFREHAQQAEDAKQLRKEAAALNEAAAQKLAEANKLIADNKAAAERLAVAQREAEEAKVGLTPSFRRSPTSAAASTTVNDRAET